jgi:hypothetical protein
MVDFFYKRTAYHIGLVERNINFLSEIEDLKEVDKTTLIQRALIHDQSKYEQDELIPYIWLTWYYLNSILLNDVDKEIRSIIEKAIQHHLYNNRHHIEF